MSIVFSSGYLENNYYKIFIIFRIEFIYYCFPIYIFKIYSRKIKYLKWSAYNNALVYIGILIQCWELHNVSRRKDKIRVHKSFAIRNVSSTKWEHVYLRYENIREREREGWGEEELRTNRNLQVLSQIQKVCAARELHVCAPLWMCARREIKRSVQATRGTLENRIRIPFDRARAVSLDAKAGLLCGDRDRKFIWIWPK